MRFAIVGAGGVGGFYGGLLARAKVPTTFVVRPGEHLQQLRQNGLKIESEVAGSFTVPVEVVEHTSKIDPTTDVILVCCKTYDLEDVAKSLQSVVRASTIIITLQNGVNSDLYLQERLPTGRVIPGISWIFAERTGPGKIVQTTENCRIIFGARKGQSADGLDQVASVMSQANILVKHVTNIETALWEKFALLATFSGLAGTVLRPAGPILNDPEARQLIQRCVDEVIAVGRACGVALRPELSAEITAKICSLGPQSKNKPSLLVDIENQRQTETDMLQGELVRLARKHHVDVPIFSVLSVTLRLRPHPISFSKILRKIVLDLPNQYSTFIKNFNVFGRLSVVQATDADVESGLIEGIELLPEFVSLEEETSMVQEIEARPWETLRQRRVQHYGLQFHYGPNVVDVMKTPEPLPEFLSAVAKRLEAYNITPNQCTINEYQPGQGIAPHVDTHSVFEDSIISLSLCAQVVMDFRYPNESRRFSLILPRRSLLIIKASARYGWLHGIVPRKTDQISPGVIIKRDRRISLTFRQVRTTPWCACNFPNLCDLKQNKTLNSKDQVQDT